MSQPLDGSRLRIFTAAGEAGITEQRTTTMPFPGDVQKRIFSLLTLEELRISLRERVSEIGQTNPSKASLISTKILFYQGTARERKELESLGIQVPDTFLQGGLPGGMLRETAGLLSPSLKGALKILVEGDEQEVRKKTADTFVKAKIQLPNGEWIEGLHSGERILSDPVRSLRTFGMKRFYLLANGHGKFISEKVEYEGNFLNNLFHDLEGKAKYFIDQETQYTGSFLNGKRSRQGDLEKYNPEKGEFYLYYCGTWKEDQPETGTYYSSQGITIARIQDGVMQEQQRVTSEFLPLSSQTPQNLNAGFLEPSEEKDAEEGLPRGLFNFLSYPRSEPQGRAQEPSKKRTPSSSSVGPSKASRVPISSPPSKPKVPLVRTPLQQNFWNGSGLKLLNSLGFLDFNRSELLVEFAFGKADWEKYFGEVEEEPLLPADIQKILSSPCPFWEGKRVQDTHILTLVPKSVNGRPLTLNSLEELIQRPRGGGHATKYSYCHASVKEEFGDRGIDRSCWVLMTKDMIKGSLSQSYDKQRALIEEYAKRTGLHYEMPHALEAAASILMHHVKTGERLYTDKTWTYTRCQEKTKDGWSSLMVGGFSAAGLDVIYYEYFSACGVGGVRKDF
ncbi:MAG: hypothetical protein WB791_06410 [Waddliaceae bacterium]